MSPEDKTNTEKGKSSYIAFKEAQSDEDRIIALLEVQRADMESEIDAWNYRKAVADILKIDELVYEDLMSFALEHYFLKSLEDIAVSIDLEQVTCKELEIVFIDPKSGQDIRMSVSELQKYIEERYKNNKIIAIDRSAKQIISKYSKIPD
ncbi:hypothetical protein COW83_00835 [Candidatus Collierbacteria bacterium CG22_combo_CG10-13_8_21_14_all_43_12]|uniref:Uncharacterized protein n=1 Tax=Candidatus Collierbacteria bacterium CG22_combo_CG10-13_8_21_14_all_43_12 TaxID=1974537 RepID=A0A2H0DV65_9BACT|nr:MAG: hypothetical protein COW83_00835 [Candidatus Collierbacteria bacterium CG22_combo_CG10-13_8_21_14_all_43_12]